MTSFASNAAYFTKVVDHLVQHLRGIGLRSWMHWKTSILTLIDMKMAESIRGREEVLWPKILYCHGAKIP